MILVFPHLHKTVIIKGALDEWSNNIDHTVFIKNTVTILQLFY